MEEIRSAASFEGLVVLAVIYFVLSTLSRSRRRRGRPLPAPPLGEAAGETATQREGFSLESVLREIERVKREAEAGAAELRLPPGRPHLQNPALKPKPAGERPRALPSAERQGRMAKAQTDAGPLGRHGRTRLPGAEEMEDRTSLEEGGSLEVAGELEVLDQSQLRRRVEVDQDEGAEAVVERRIREAEARNTAFSEADHRKFHERIKPAEAAPVASRKRSIAQLREALIWREILGPPKSLE
jgi:hypothetical protein